MRRKLTLLIVAVALLVIDSTTNKAYAQQDPQYSMYMFNGLSVNPAYAGSRERLAILAVYRDQWTGFKGAPRTFTAAAHAPLLNERIGLGVAITSDNIGILNAVNVTGSFAYRLPVGKGKLKGRLCFGLSASMDYDKQRLTESEIITPGDPSFTQNLSVVSPNFGAGVYYYNDRFYLGLSAPHFLNGSLDRSAQYSGTSELGAREYRHAFFTAGGMVNVSENVKFKPSIMIKYVQGAPVNMDFNASFLFKEALWVGVSFRTAYNEPTAVVGMIEYMFAKSFRLGYAYDYTLTQIGQYSSGSHEILLSYEFGRVDKYLTPRKMSYF